MENKKKRNKMLNFEADEELILQLKKIAKEDERNLSAEIRFIILSYLKERLNGKTNTNT